MDGLLEHLYTYLHWFIYYITYFIEFHCLHKCEIYLRLTGFLLPKSGDIWFLNFIAREKGTVLRNF